MSNKKNFFVGLIFSLIIFSGVFFSVIITRSAASSTLNINFTVPSGFAVCGNGVVETGEDCDGSDLNGYDCTDFSFGCGDLSCTASCTFNTVNCSNTCGGGGSSTDITPPVISNVLSEPSLTSAHISWIATDNSTEIPECIFNYGLDTSYSSSTMVYNNANDFWVDLISLESNTKYYYQIRCEDNSLGYVLSNNEFTTLETIPEKTLSLEVYARPEKRKDDFAFDALLLFVEPISRQVFKMTQIEFSDAGYFMGENLDLPIYNNMDVYIKGRSHLAKKISGVTIEEDTDNMVLNFTDSNELETWGNYYLSAGDVQGDWPGLKDNVADVLDLSVLEIRTNLENDLDSDLNRDVITDVLDISIVLNNFNFSGDGDNLTEFLF